MGQVTGNGAAPSYYSQYVLSHNSPVISNTAAPIASFSATPSAIAPATPAQITTEIAPTVVITQQATTIRVSASPVTTPASSETVSSSARAPSRISTSVGHPVSSGNPVSSGSPAQQTNQPTSSPKPSSNAAAVGGGVGGAAAVIILGILGWFLWRRHKRQQQGRPGRQDFEDQPIPSAPTQPHHGVDGGAEKAMYTSATPVAPMATQRSLNEKYNAPSTPNGQARHGVDGFDEPNAKAFAAPIPAPSSPPRGNSWEGGHNAPVSPPPPNELHSDRVTSELTGSTAASELGSRPMSYELYGGLPPAELPANSRYNI